MVEEIEIQKMLDNVITKYNEVEREITQLQDERRLELTRITINPTPLTADRNRLYGDLIRRLLDKSRVYQEEIEYLSNALQDLRQRKSPALPEGFSDPVQEWLK